jgi:hypothetical protein
MHHMVNACGCIYIWLTYAAGAAVAFDTVVLLICLACSLTLNLASTMEGAAADEGDPDLVDFARANDNVAFVVPFTRSFEAGIAMTEGEWRPKGNQKPERESVEKTSQ